MTGAVLPPRTVPRGHVLRGSRLYLRELTVDDVTPRYCEWMNDPVVCRYLESRFAAQSMEGLREYVARIRDRDDTLFWGVFLTEGHRHIGNVKLGPIEWRHDRGEIGILIGEKDCWGRGYASEALGLVAGHAFAVLSLNKVSAGCYANNDASIRAFQKAGFQIDGVRRRHYHCEGRYVDLVQLGRLKAEAALG